MSYLDGQWLPRQPIQFVGGQISPRRVISAPVRTYRTFVSDTATQTTYTFNSINVGTTPTLVVVAAHVGAAAARTIVSATIDGVEATLHGSSPGSFSSVGFFSRAFTPGGTITITVTWSASCIRGAIGVWTIENLLTPVSHGTDFAAGASDASRTRTIAVPANGIALFAGSRGNTTAVTTSIDLGAIAEDYETAVESANNYVGASSINNGGASPTATMANVSAMAGISFGGPAPGYSYEFKGAVTDPNNLTTYTFSSLDFGAAHANREIFVSIIGNTGSSRTVSSVTIGGVTASLGSLTSSASSLATIAYATVPAGTSGSIVVTLSGAGQGTSIAWYRVQDRPGIGTGEADFADGSGSAGNVTVTGAAYTAGAMVFSTLLVSAGSDDQTIHVWGDNVTKVAMTTDSSTHVFGASGIQTASGSGSVAWDWDSSFAHRSGVWVFD